MTSSEFHKTGLLIKYLNKICNDISIELGLFFGLFGFIGNDPFLLVKKNFFYYITTYTINIIFKTIPMFLFFLLPFLPPSLPLPALAIEKIQTSCSINRRPWHLQFVNIHLCRGQGSSETKFFKYRDIKTLRVIRFPPVHRGKSPAIALVLILLRNGWLELELG